MVRLKLLVGDYRSWNVSAVLPCGVCHRRKAGHGESKRKKRKEIITNPGETGLHEDC